MLSPDNAKVVPEGQRSCPICKAPMQTKHRDAETIDVCDEHGVWLDRHELERMFLARARRRGRIADRRVREARLDAWFWEVVV